MIRHSDQLMLATCSCSSAALEKAEILDFAATITDNQNYCNLQLHAVYDAAKQSDHSQKLDTVDCFHYEFFCYIRKSIKKRSSHAHQIAYQNSALSIRFTTCFKRI